MFESHIAGTGYIEDIDEYVESICEGSLVEFKREPSNSHDSFAIACYAEGNRIGYVPRKDNIVFSRLMDAGKLLYGKVKRMSMRGVWYHIVMGIYLKD